MPTQLESVGGELFINGKKVLLADDKSVATAWGVFDGVADSQLSSYNMTITRTALGIYQVAFTTPMANADYCITGTRDRPSGSTESVSVTMSIRTEQHTVNGFVVHSNGTNGNSTWAIDSRISVSVFGGK